MKRREVLQSVGTLFALGIVPTASALLVGRAEDQTPAPVINLNHVLVRVPDMEKAKKFYAETFGFREAFSVPNQGRIPAFTYLQISSNTFLELQPASDEHPPGIGHIGLEVTHVDDTVKTLRERGLDPRDPGASQRTKARISSVQATPGVTFELLEFPADSLVRKAMNTWKYVALAQPWRAEPPE